MSFSREEALLAMRGVTQDLKKHAIASPATSRPGPGMDQMGQGMAPFPIRQQPVTAANTQNLLGKQLVQYARKSTSAMKRNSGSVVRSAERQKPKRTSGGLIGNTEPILQENKEVVASVAATAAKKATKERLALLLKKSKGTQTAANNSVVSYASEKRKEAAMTKEAVLPLLARGWQAARGVGARLFGAGRTGATSRAPQQMRLPLGPSTAPASRAGQYSNLPGPSHVVSSGAGTSAPGAFHKAREVAQRTPGYLFGRGSGFKNVYKTKDTGKMFSSYRPRALRPKNWEVVKAYHQTGGVVNQAAKGMLGGALKGGLGAYGLSWALNREAAWDDPKRLNMALGGAVLFPSMFQGMPAAVGTAGLMATNKDVRGMAGRFTPSVGALWHSRAGGKHGPDHTKKMTSLQMMMGGADGAMPSSERSAKMRAKAKELNRKAQEATKKHKQQAGQTEASAAEGARVQARQDAVVKK